MDLARYDALITRLEDTAHRTPARYVRTVVGVALLGFLILGLAVGLTALALLALALLVFAVFASGGKALIVLAKLGKLLILLVLPAWAMLRAAFTLLFARFPHPAGRPLTRNEAPALFAHLDALRSRVQGPRIHTVLVTDELNAAIVQHPRFGLFGWEKNILILGLPLLQALEEPEALAVVAHEYGHLAGCHGRLGGFIYRLRAAWGRLQALSEQWNDWGSRLIARLFRWYAPYFNAYTFVLARQHEYAADRFSAEVVGSSVASQALVRINIAGFVEHERFWPEIDRTAARQPEPIADRSRRWAQLAAASPLELGSEACLERALKRVTDHHDTHPSLRDRLAAIAGDDTAPLPPPSLDHSAATVWLAGSLSRVEAELDQTWRQTVAERWQARHSHLAECRQRLSELDGQAEFAPGERWERIRLMQELDPANELRPEVEALLAEEPEHLSARFLRGRLRLEAGEPGGAEDIEAVMAADPGATLSGCEILWRHTQESEPAAAETYRRRWQERADYEQRVEQELATLPPKARLAPAELPPEVLAEIAGLIARDGKHVRKAYLLRRVLASDPSVPDYVLAFETRRFTLGNKGPAMCKALATGPYPIRLFIVHLGSQTYRGFRKTIKKLGVAPLFPAPR